jgi:hypothetical protein
MAQIKARWTKLADESWGIQVEGPKADTLAGKTVVVRKRNGELKEVTLYQLVQSWERKTKATYTVPPRKKNSAPPQKPRGKIEVTTGDIKAMFESGYVTVGGVTLVWTGGE